jgi:hypothetical protein
MSEELKKAVYDWFEDGDILADFDDTAFELLPHIAKTGDVSLAMFLLRMREIVKIINDELYDAEHAEEEGPEVVSSPDITNITGTWSEKATYTHTPA